MDKSFFDYAIPSATLILGYLIGWLRHKWIAEEARRAEIERFRRPIYQELYTLLCALEKCQYQYFNLGPAIARFEEWINSKATHLAPQAHDVLSEVRSAGRELYVVSQQNDADRSFKVNKDFNEILYKAKMFFIENEAIRWLLEDRDNRK